MLGVALMALAGAAAPTAVLPLDDIFTTFDQICIGHTELADQKKAAEALPNVVKEVRPRRDEKTGEEQYPATIYHGIGFQVGMIGYSENATCYVTAHIDPAMDADGLRDAVATRFAGKPHKAAATKNFYHGGWVTKDQAFEMEWQHKDDGIVALLSVRRRDGFTK